MKNLSINLKIEMAVKMATFDAIKKAQENKNDSFELQELKVKTFIKTATFKKNVDLIFNELQAFYKNNY
jgi:hypothetical protein